MVSYLVMKLDINGDYTTKINFTPSMSDRSSRKDKIFFRQHLKLLMKL